jgi:signal transduction histidine kinase
VSDDFFDDLNDMTPESEPEADLENSGSVETGLSKLASLIEDLNRDLTATTILDRAMDAAIELTGAERGFLVLLSENGEWNFHVAKNMDKEEIEHAETAASHTVIRKVLEGKQPILINDVVGASDMSKQQSIANMRVRSIMGAPLISKGNILGAAYVDTTRLAGVFDNTSLVLFETFVQLATVAIENSRLIEAEHDATIRYRELQEYLYAVLQSQPHGVLIFDTDLRIEYLSPPVKRLLNNHGVSRGTVIGKSMLNDDETTLQFMDHLQEFMRTGITGRYFFNKANRSLAYSFFLVRSNEDSPERVGLILEDITTQRQLEQQLIESEKRSTVNQLAGGIAHEINNSLQPVKGRIELLGLKLERAGIAIDKGIDKELETIGMLITRIERIVQNLRHLSKPAKPEQSPLDLSLLIQNTVELLENTTPKLRGFARGDKESPYHLDLDLDDNLPPLLGDPQALEGMFINLILNSAHAIKEKTSGRLTIRTFHQGEQIITIVEDTGTGIRPELLPRVFEPYFTTKENAGTGLGMCIVQNVAEIHHAKLDLKSIYGEGTTITISFPAMTPARQRM